ncbi:hypothetical protein [Paracoccus versutus]|uniref:Uncharacterized protein n=1 Tax=Paracoccus versutus TaxID=34007 RepID=A0A3D9XIW2_PARVE|nr:hypothetical protein [Paracoccus versutus]REF70384.1 hypothetical protein BDD41_3116 [Paracoccus versutus]WGR57304.1 hypothetical protein E3U25_14980 [Paracoccus versutus]
MKFKETAEDLAVKDRLWDATERELEHFARLYAEGHVAGFRYRDAQKDATSAAKRRGYPKGLVRDLGAVVRKGEWGGGRLG